MTDNTQSLIDRMAEALRAMQLTAIDYHADKSKAPELFRAASKANCVIVEYEAHKASHGDKAGFNLVEETERVVNETRIDIYGRQVTATGQVNVFGHKAIR